MTAVSMLGLQTAVLANNGPKPLYCPNVTELGLTMCQTGGAYNQDPLPFPRCLILFKGRTFTFSDGLSWKLASVTPPLSTSTKLQFQTAYINKQGVFCAYRAKIDNVYIALQLNSKQVLLPNTTGWKTNNNGKAKPYQQNTFNPKINYSCIPSSHKVKDCPFNHDKSLLATQPGKIQ